MGDLARSSAVRTAVRLASVVLGFTFLASAVSKALDIDDFALVLGWNFKAIASHPAVWSAVGLAVICWELVIGVLLISGHSRLVSLLALITLCAYSAVLLHMMADPLAPKCNCTSWLALTDRIAQQTEAGLVRNAIMFGMALGCAVIPTRTVGPPGSP